MFCRILANRTPGSITMTVHGHNKPITAVSKRADDPRVLVTGDSEGRVVSWQTESGVGEQVRGAGPSNQVNGLAAGGDDDSVLAVGIDDTLRRAEAGEFTELSVKLDAQPRAVRGCDGATAVATVKKLLLLSKDGGVLKERALDFEPSSLDFCPQLGHLAVGEGGGGGQSVRVYSIGELVRT